MSERIRTFATALFLLALLSVVVGMTLLFLVPDFSADLNRVFVAGPQLNSHTTGMNFIEDGYDPVVDYFAGGVRFAVLGLLALGIPLSICAMVLRAANRRSALDQQWGTTLQMGFLFQLGSLVLAAAALLLMSFDGLQGYARAPFFSLMLGGDVVFGAAVLSSWRCLQERRTQQAF